MLSLDEARVNPPEWVIRRRSPSPTVVSMGGVGLLALTAALNPSLLAAVTIMLALPNPRRLLAGYLLGAGITSVTCGLVLVFALPGTSTEDTARHTVSPAVDLVLGALLLLVVAAFASQAERRRAWSERRRARSKDKAPPRWKRTLSRGSARDTFIVGVLLSFPGASYIAGMTLLSKQNVSDAVIVLVVLAFNATALILLELPLIGYLLRPESTAATVDRFGAWVTRTGPRIVVIGGTFIGCALILRGLLSL
jgi:hypothetical protein